MTAPSISSAASRYAYRPDIDGLRAVAVLAVVLFHLGIERLEGGFLGVDVFFVISGFLITSIIAPKMVAGTFSFKDFYLGRIRRLIPSALVTVAFTFLASAFILGPAELLAMAKSAIAAVFSVSNILFFTEAGYWDAQSELKPLLHTWSLGVEEQFYLFWPLLVLAFWKLSPKLNLAWAFGVATIIGLIVSELILRANPSAAFYLLPARFFEFSIGATFAFIGKSGFWDRFATASFRVILGFAGLLILLATIWLYKGDTPFPGINAVLPCFATAMLLLSGSGATATPGLGQLLGNPVITWLGRVSYSLYLVHWPVVSLMRYKVGLELHLHHQIIAAALMAVLTLVLYYGIEKRFSSRAGQRETATSKPRLTNGRFAIRTGAVAVALSAVFTHASFNSGWTWRYDDLSFTPEQAKDFMSDRQKLTVTNCNIQNYPAGLKCDADKSLVVLVMGDSHEWEGINFLTAGYGDDENLQIVRFGQLNRCKKKNIKARGFGKGSLFLDDPKCQKRVDYLLTPEVAKKIDIVAYSANKPFFPNEVVNLRVLKDLKAVNPDLKLLTFGSFVVTDRPCTQLINDSGDAKSCVDENNVTHWFEMDKRGDLYEEFMGLTDAYINRGELLCTSSSPSSCESQTPGGQIAIIDTNHLTFEFAQYAGRKFAKENPNLLRDLAGESRSD